MKSLLKSRKFWLAVAGVVSVAASETLGLSEDQVRGIVILLVSMIVGIALEDAGAKAGQR